MSKKAKEKKREQEYQLELRRIEMRGQVLSLLIRWGGAATMVGLFSYFGLYLGGALSQLNSLEIGSLLEVGVELGGILFGLLGILYGRNERRLRKDAIEHMADYKSTLERLIDPSRTSSGLTLRGDTQPEDGP